MLHLPNPPTYTEKELLLRIAEGDEAAFHAVYTMYSGKVYGMALRYLRSAFTAQDIVQEVFSKVWQQRSGIPALENFDSWLTTITKNLLINQLKKIIPVAMPENYEKQPTTPQGAPLNPVTDYLDYRELETLLNNAVQQLPQRQKQVYELSRNAGLSHKDIAGQLGISYDMTREHMSKALKNIRALLEKQYGPLGLLICLLFDI